MCVFFFPDILFIEDRFCRIKVDIKLFLVDFFYIYAWGCLSVSVFMSIILVDIYCLLCLKVRLYLCMKVSACEA